MKKRDVFLFISFLVLFVLFAVFQNFSFPTEQLEQIANKGLFQKQLQKFIPTYSFKNFIGENLETPYGYKKEINRRIENGEKPLIFDEKKFLKERVIESMPLYGSIKDLIDLDDTTASIDTHCDQCSSESTKSKISEHAKIRTNPLRGTASISVPGDVQSLMTYESGGVNMQFKKDLNKNSDLKLKLDSEEKSGSINIDVRW